MTIRRAADTIANSPNLPERVVLILPERGHLALDLIRRDSIEGANLRFVMPSLREVRNAAKERAL